MSSVAAHEHTYRYAFESEFAQGSSGGDLTLATSGGASAFPYFFQGQIKYPRLTAQLLRSLSKVVTSRFHIPPAMLKKILMTRDPVVTCGGGMLRFEGFSACCSTFARVDLSPEGYDGVVVNQGTTNVDFNAGMRSALAQIRDGERVGLAVGADEVTLLRNEEQIVERKVKLPNRWIKGFVELHAYQSRMKKRLHIGKIEALRFLRAVPRSTAAKSVYWILPAGRGLRLSQMPSEEGIRIAGIERLRVLDDLAPLADSLTVFADDQGEASEWQLQCGALRFHLTLSAEVWRGFSGEGQVLSDLAASEQESLVQLVQGMLKWQAEIRPEEFISNWDASPEQLRQAFAALGSCGLVGYDVARAAYFHRELPFDLGLIEEMHPRLKNARKIVEADGVRVLHQESELIEAEVPGTGVTHRVRLGESGDRCTCTWFAKHQGQRGPCKHILAVQIVTEMPEE